MSHRNANSRDRHFRAVADQPTMTRRQPRPSARRTSTRQAVIAAALADRI